jgi:predicted amidohydrolase YtcJ
MKQTVILGNIITMDEKRPFAKAALVKDGVFAFIGNTEEVRLTRPTPSSPSSMQEPTWCSIPTILFLP